MAALLVAAAAAGCSSVSSTALSSAPPTAVSSAPPRAAASSTSGAEPAMPELGAARSLEPAAVGRSVQTGYASWYGQQHHGRRTASGETYDMHELTAAHPTLPMGTRLLVTNLRNGRSAEVRVNDRGPVVEGRIIDLSYAAARRVGAIDHGVVPVRVRVVAPSPP
jgi:rare lipoprotein A